MRITLPILFAVVSGLALAIPASAQQAGDATTATEAPQDANLLTPEELQTLVAPVALYPDTLLIQVLIGATAPLDVIKADRLLTDNEGTDQAELGPLVEAENYDESVEVLAMAFPTVLQQMAVHIDWTEAVGAAMLAQSDDVMDAVQVKRNEAIASGALTDTPQQVITNEADSDVVVIQPANPEVVYVPQYDPQVVYSQPSNGVNDALAGGLMFFGTVALIDNIFDDDDDWHGYWGCRDCGGWGGGPIYRNPDIDIDVDGNVNIGNRLDIDRDKVKIDRDKMKIDPDRRPDGGWQPSKDKSDAARDRISNHRKPDGSTKMQLDRPASRSDELRNKLSKEGIGNGRGPGGQGFGGDGAAAAAGLGAAAGAGALANRNPNIGRDQGRLPQVPDRARPAGGGDRSAGAKSLAQHSGDRKAVHQPKVAAKPSVKPSAKPKAKPGGGKPKIAKNSSGARAKASSSRGNKARTGKPGGGKKRR